MGKMDEIAEVANGNIKLYYETPDARKHYPVGLDMVNTQEKLLGVILHLCEKAWVTRKHIQYLIAEVSERNGLKIDFA